MQRRFSLLLALAILVMPLGARAQSSSTASLSGRVVHADHVTRAGERVLLYDYAAKTWIGPALTDDFGTYAFYGVAAGTYLVTLYSDGKPVWSATVTLSTFPSRYDIRVAR
jgi:hypothetical protein